MTIAYDPTDHEVEITLPTVITNGAAIKEMPTWLEQRSTSGTTADAEIATVFTGALPKVDVSEGNFGADDNGAFLFDALAWVPDLPNLMPTRLTLETPISHRGLSTGELIAEVETEQTYKATFQMTGTWREMDVFLGPYEVKQQSVELSSSEVALRTYFRSEEQEFSEDYLDAVAKYITRYSSELGAYPHKGFAVVSAPIPVGYALDGMTYVSQQILGHPYMLGRSLAHEVLHSWWGSGVEIDYANGNWAEGLTTYQADYALAEDHDPEAAKAMRREWLAALSSLPTSDDRPLREFQSAGHNRDQSVGYGKSAMVFHMLRHNLGQSAFEESLKRFWQANKGDVADWTDIQQAFETVSGRDLGAFFAQWLDQQGLPRLSLDGASVKAAGDGYTVEAQLSQSGVCFSLEVPILIETVSGDINKKVLFDCTSENFEFNLADQPLSISVDPDFDVLRKLVDGELAPTVRDVLRAETIVAIVGEEAEGSADSLLPQLLRNAEELRRVKNGVALPSADAFIAIGATDEVTELRAGHFEGDAPSVARKGAVRAWVEKDGNASFWLFISADDVDDIADDLSALRYYTNQSFITREPGVRPSGGRWPVENSPMQISLK
ncbi:M1 family metallopeptidase [Marimonas lutisalis]|uniref:M1 family metallopeptidase n=1 Tax=Marimonas lutisalis TaxID=2545756 RepID=UPI0010F99C4C|nr:M1 family aminopeptidase [Marimonas lutisalis]